MPDVILQCPSITNRTSKGEFIWEETLAGLISSQPCKEPQGGNKFATHKCGMDGQWQKLNVKDCDFVSILTQRLARLAKIGVFNFLLLNN